MYIIPHQLYAFTRAAYRANGRRFSFYMSAAARASARSSVGSRQSIAAPALRGLPDRERGTPSFQDSFACACEMPSACRHENENPGIPPFFCLPTRLFSFGWFIQHLLNILEDFADINNEIIVQGYAERQGGSGLFLFGHLVPLPIRINGINIIQPKFSIVQ